MPRVIMIPRPRAEDESSTSILDKVLLLDDFFTEHPDDFLPGLPWSEAREARERDLAGLRP